MKADKIVCEIEKLEDKLQYEIPKYSEKYGNGKLEFFYLGEGTFLMRGDKDSGLQRIDARSLKNLANWIINITGKE